MEDYVKVLILITKDSTIKSWCFCDARKRDLSFDFNGAAVR